MKSPRIDGRTRVNGFVPTPKAEVKKATADVDDDDFRLDVHRQHEELEHPWYPVAIAILAQAADEALSGPPAVAAEALAFLRGEGEYAGSVEIWCDVAGIAVDVIQRRFVVSSTT